LNGYPVARIQAFYRQTLEKLRAVPGVKSVGFAMMPLLAGSEWDSYMSVEGHQAKDGEDMQAFMNGLSPGYFTTMGVPLLAGRDFNDSDAGDRFRVAIVNRKFAAHFFGDKSPLGRRIGFGGGPNTRLNIEIVGMTEDTLYEGPREGVRRQVFVPFFESNFPGSVTFYVRTATPSETMFATVRRIVQEYDSSLPIYSMKTLENRLDETLSTERLIAALSAAFGVLATLLAAIGLYGVMAFVVARRTKEIGLRMALGAARGTVVWMVLREALLMLAIGLAIGGPAAYMLSGYVSSQLFGMKPADLLAAISAFAILAAVAAGAGFLPARRASAIDPIQALRYE
jgi:predicted permease